MSRKITLVLGRNTLGDDLAGQMKVMRIASQAIIDLIAQEHEVIVTHGNEPQVSMINQAFEAITKAEVHLPMLSMSICIALSQGYIDYGLQNTLGEELLFRSINKPVVTLATQVEVNASDSVLPNSTKPIDSFFTEQEAEQLTKQGYTLREDAGRGYRRVVVSSKPVDIIEKETVKTLVDTGQVVIAVGGGSIPVIRKGNHLCSAGMVIDKDWASACLAEIIDVDMPVILTVVEKMAINLGKENEQWLDRLSLGGAERFIEEGHFAGGSTLSKMEIAALFARSRTGRGVLITVLSKTKEGIEGKAGAMICQ